MINCKKLRFYNGFTVDFTVVGGQIGCPYFTIFFFYSVQMVYKVQEILFYTATRQWQVVSQYYLENNSCINCDQLISKSIQLPGSAPFLFFVFMFLVPTPQLGWNNAMETGIQALADHFKGIVVEPWLNIFTIRYAIIEIKEAYFYNSGWRARDVYEEQVDQSSQMSSRNSTN